ncbi:MAG TPA: DUF4270 family protein [Bacteroidia bacterium]|nr:DUF4270 family protein [Bacteroidia bacterium]
MRLFVKTGRHFLGCLFVFIIFIYGCKEPDNVGLEVLPPSDLSSLSYSDTISLLTTLIREDSVPTTGNSAALLGAIREPLFGEANAGFYSQVLLSNVGVDFGSATCDSIILTLAYSGYYGDTTASHSFEVYRISENILPDNLYYSNKTFSTSDLLGTLTTSDIRPRDSVLVNGNKTAPHLRIPLSASAANIFLNQPSSVYASNSAFIDYFKGIYVKDVSSPATGGSILYFGFSIPDTMSKITLYYAQGLSFTFLFPVTTVTNLAERINHFTHDYSTGSIANQFNNPELTKDICYVQSMAGVKTKVEFPFLDNLVQSGNISVNIAELAVTIDNSTTGTYAAHSNLFLTGIDSAGKSYFLPDFVYSESNFGGAQTNGTYTFLITRYIQQVLSGSRNDYGLYLVASGASVNANRTVIGGSHNPSFRMKLKLSYTNINP